MATMGVRYELRLCGTVPAAVLAELNGVVRPPTGDETLLVTGWMNQNRLQNLLARIADLGLDIRELRRLAEPVPAAADDGGWQQ